MGGAEEEGALHPGGDGDEEGTLGVRNDVVLVVRERHARWVTSTEEVPLPHWGNGRGFGAAGEFRHAGQELEKPAAVAHRVI